MDADDNFTSPLHCLSQILHLFARLFEDIRKGGKLSIYVSIDPARSVVWFIRAIQRPIYLPTTISSTRRHTKVAIQCPLF